MAYFPNLQISDGGIGVQVHAPRPEPATRHMLHPARRRLHPLAHDDHLQPRHLHVFGQVGEIKYIIHRKGVFMIRLKCSL